MTCGQKKVESDDDTGRGKGTLFLVLPGASVTDHEEHTAKAELVGTRDKEHSGYLGKIMSVHYTTIKVMRRGNSENSK